MKYLPFSIKNIFIKVFAIKCILIYFIIAFVSCESDCDRNIECNEIYDLLVGYWNGVIINEHYRNSQLASSKSIIVEINFQNVAKVKYYNLSLDTICYNYILDCANLELTLREDLNCDGLPEVLGNSTKFSALIELTSIKLYSEINLIDSGIAKKQISKYFLFK